MKKNNPIVLLEIRSLLYSKLLTEEVVDAAVMEINILPGETKYTNTIRVIVFDRATRAGEKGKNISDPGWHQMAGFRPDKPFFKWFVEVLDDYDPVYIMDTGGLPEPQYFTGQYDVKYQIEISIDRLNLVAATPTSRTDEEILDNILNQAEKPEWFKIIGDPDAGFWYVVTQVDEPGFLEDFPEPEEKQQFERRFGKTRSTLVLKYNEAIQRLAVKSGKDEFVVEAAVSQHITRVLNLDEPFDIHTTSGVRVLEGLALAERLTVDDIGHLLEETEKWIAEILLEQYLTEAGGEEHIIDIVISTLKDKKKTDKQKLDELANLIRRTIRDSNRQIDVNSIGSWFNLIIRQMDSVYGRILANNEDNIKNEILRIEGIEDEKKRKEERRRRYGED